MSYSENPNPLTLKAPLHQKSALKKVSSITRIIPYQNVRVPAENRVYKLNDGVHTYLKIVKVRKSQECIWCKGIIKIGEFALVSQGQTGSGHYYRTYTCNKCFSLVEEKDILKYLSDNEKVFEINNILNKSREKSSLSEDDNANILDIINSLSVDTLKEIVYCYEVIKLKNIWKEKSQLISATKKLNKNQAIEDILEYIYSTLSLNLMPFIRKGEIK